METLKGWSSLRGLLLIFLLSSTSIILFLQIAGLESRQSAATASMSEEKKPSEDWCLLPRHPSGVKDDLQSSKHFGTEEFLKRQADRLSAAVNVPTVSYEDNGDVEHDKRWLVFGDFHKVLKDLFPLV